MKRSEFLNKTLDRRRFLKIGTQAMAVCLLPVPAIASINRLLTPERILYFFNTHTNEQLDVCYYIQGRYRPEALKKIDYILRDHYSEKIRPIHTDLVDLLHAVSLTFGKKTRVHIVSGYRSPETNAMLCKKNRGVARHSLHMKGEAVDIRIPGFNTRSLRSICMRLKAGGVGYYPTSDFVHVDIGRVRYW